MDDVDEAFAASVLAFIRATKDAEATEVTAVNGSGTDWAGSTEGGFYSTFSADVMWRRADGTVTGHYYEGEEMGDLWNWVVKGKRS